MTAPGRYRLDTAAMVTAVDAIRRHRGLDWAQIAAEIGISAPTMSRLAHGRNVAADTLVALLMWLGHGESLGPYLIRQADGEAPSEAGSDEPAGEWAMVGEPGPDPDDSA